MTCPNCNVQLSEEWKFCRDCGTAIPAYDPLPKETSTENQAVTLQNDVMALENRKKALEREIETANRMLERKQKEFEQLSQRQESSRLNKMRELEQMNKRHEAIRLKRLQELERLNKQIIVAGDEIYFQDFALYRPTYDFAHSEEYAAALAEIRNEQKSCVKNQHAVTGDVNWEVSGSKRKGNKLVADTQKLLLRAFNNECEMAVSKVKYSNFEQSLNRIVKSHDAILKLGVVMRIAITDVYFDLKVSELRLAFEYAQKKQQEKEEQKALREQMREEEKLAREIEKERQKLAKERNHYENALAKIKEQIAKEQDNQDLIEKQNSLVATIEDIEKAEKDIDYREANKRAGYVYIISNIGSFGEGVYKIGMSRRLDPTERVDELGDASVPFRFDIHAMIFSDDAPKLENALHKAFEDKRLNTVNLRREYFNVTLDEIKKEVRKNYDKTIEWYDIPDAEQYRISQKMKAS